MQILPPSTTKSIAARISQRTINLGEPRVAAEEGDGSRDIASTDIRHDADHGKTAVVELPAALLLKSLGVDAGEVELGEDDLGERSALCVVGALGLGLELGNEDGADDLSLAGEGDGLPGIEGVHLREGLEGDIRGQHAGEVDAGGLDHVAGGGKHGNSAVFELGGTEPGEGLVGSELRKAEGVEVLSGGGGATERSKVSGEGSGDLVGSLRGKGGGRAGAGKEQSGAGLHFY